MTICGVNMRKLKAVLSAPINISEKRPDWKPRTDYAVGCGCADASELLKEIRVSPTEKSGGGDKILRERRQTEAVKF